jgi:hypothetical protein
LPEDVVTRLVSRVLGVGTHRKRSVEEDFLAFPIRDSMLLPVLANVAVVPIEAFAFDYQTEIDHALMYIANVYASSSRFRSTLGEDDPCIGASTYRGLRFRFEGPSWVGLT